MKAAAEPELVVFDTETTGLLDNHLMRLQWQPEIIEFYGCRIGMKSGKVLAEHHTLIKPQRAPSAEITKITGITAAMLENAPPFEAAMSRIVGMLSKAPAICAHNLSFDMEMIDLELERLETSIAWPERRICTVEQTVHLKGFRLNLAALYEHLFNSRFPEAHRAKSDTQALCRCVVELVKRGEL